MNTPAHFLSLFSAIMHLIIGLSGLFNIGPRFLPPSWVQLYSIIPGTEWAYPTAYVLTGIVAVIGVKRPSALRWSCCMSAMLFFVWGLLGIYSISQGTGGNIQGSAANLYIAGAALVLAYYVRVGTRSDRIDKKAEKLREIGVHDN